MPDVVPMLSYADAGAAADWLVRAFGFEESDRFEEDGKVTHVTLRHGNGVVFLGTPGDYVDPIRLRELSDDVAKLYDVPWVVDGVWVRVDDVHAHRERAEAEGARVLSVDEQGPRAPLYRAEDPFGHRWMFAQR
jgi:uncharacterized glyoxalase superfamily protein PhnB